MIKTLNELYKAMDKLFAGISDSCEKCDYDDCKGYIWLLPAESSKLFQAGVPILEVNEGISFISPFEEKDIDVEKFKPDCLWCKERKCTIRKLRPLTCRMYPLNFLKKGDIIYLALHLDCLYSQSKKDDQEFKSKAIDLLKSIDQKLLNLILEVYLSYEGVTKFPFGPNRCMVLMPIGEQKGGKLCQSALQ